MNTFEVLIDHGWVGRLIQWYASRLPDHPAKRRILLLLVKNIYRGGVNFRTRAGIRFQLPSDETFSQLFLVRRGYESSTLKRCEEILPFDGVFIDIGANFGLFTCLLARPRSRKVLAVEPYPPNLDLLRFHVKSNGLANVQIAPVALGDSIGFIEIGLDDPHNPGVARHLPSHPSAVKVKRQIFDTLLRENNLDRVDLVKIDVEGAEMEVIRGIDFNSLRRPKHIIVEYYPERDTSNDIFNYMQLLGYDAFDVHGRRVEMPVDGNLTDHNVLFSDRSIGS